MTAARVTPEGYDAGLHPDSPSSTAPGSLGGGSTSTVPTQNGASGSTSGGSTFTSEQSSAFAVMTQMLTQYGLGSLGNSLKSLILEGVTDQNELQLRLQDMPEWKVRFAGNEKLKQAGLPVLSVAEYLSTERSYAQVLKNYGLPVGFYDDPADFAQWIGSSVSPNEVQQRAQMYSDLANRDDPALLEQISSMGLSRGDLLAYMMDAGRAQPLVAKKYQSALIGGAARRAGVTATDPGHLADLGISEQQASQGYGQIASELPGASLLGNIYHDSVSQSDLESEMFDSNGGVTNKKKRLASQERASFSGSSGVGQGSLRRSDSGSY